MGPIGIKPSQLHCKGLIWEELWEPHFSQFELKVHASGSVNAHNAFIAIDPEAVKVSLETVKDC